MLDNETISSVKRHGAKGVKASKDENVAKETEDEVKRHGVKGVKGLKDNGVEGSFVSFRQVCQYFSINHLLLTC